MDIIRLYTLKARQSIIILWVVAIAICGTMLFIWLNNDKVSLNKKNSSKINIGDFPVDQLLLTSGELEWGNSASLININLNSKGTNVSRPVNETPTVRTQPERTLDYSRILQYKIKKATPKTGNGFTIKPLPQ